MKRSETLKVTGFFGAALVMAGCGGSSTSAVTSFAELSADTNALNSIFALEAASTIPSGEASYTGVAVLVETDAVDVIFGPDDLNYSYSATGRFTSDVNFDAGTISGRMFDFYEAADPNEAEPTASGSVGRLDGTLNFDGFVVSAASAVVVGIDAVGTLTKPSGSTAAYDIQDETLGFFAGTDASGLIIAAEGTVQEGGNTASAALAIVADAD